MDRKMFTGVFIGLLVLAIIILGYYKYQEDAAKIAVSSPEPSAGMDLFGATQQDPNSLGVAEGAENIFGQQAPTQQQQQPQQQPQPAQRQIKQYRSAPAVLPDGELKDKKVVIQTNKGIIEFEIYPEASKAASNFIFLAKEGFYDGLTFHRVEPGFVIQGGDPLGNGTGGPGYKFEDEPVTRQYDQGIVAMANSGPNTNGSQFFIMLEDNPGLPPKYTIFGKVIAGIEVVKSIKKGDLMGRVKIEQINRSL